MALLDPYTGPWTESEAGHLARRAGFGALPTELTSMASAGMNASVDAFIDYPATDAALDALIASLPNTGDGGNIRDPFGALQLAGWWLYRMRHASHPLQEQFTLFLHNMLVSDIVKSFAGVSGAVNNGNDGDGMLPAQQCTSGTWTRSTANRQTIATRLMRDQNELYRTTGLDGYRALIIAVTRNPAMLNYLDNRLNISGTAQENYAREVMELFTMGVGNYSEDDVREIAKCFTGETIDASCASDYSYARIFYPPIHQTGTKTVFGNTVAFDSTGQETITVLDMILNRISNSGITPSHSVLPAASLFLAWKFITWFVEETIAIGDPAVAELATFFYNNTSPNGYDYDVRETLRKLFKSQFFYDPAYRFGMYKNPADYIVSALRALQIDVTSYTNVAASYVSGMGMTLFSPPNVAGWHLGKAWINSGNIINRYNFANYISSSNILTDAYVDGLALADNASIIEYFRSRLIQAALRPEETTILNNFLAGVQASSGTTTAKYRRKVRGMCHLMMALPHFQLK